MANWRLLARRITSSFIIGLCLVNLSDSSLSKSIKHPVILIPGDGGSQLEAKLNKTKSVHIFCSQKTSDYFALWLNLELMEPYVLDCFVDNMRLVYDNVTRTTKNSPGVDIRIPGFGGTKTVEWLDSSEISPTSYFSVIVQDLLSMGYVRNQSVRGAPYDFRKAPNEQADFFLKFKQMIEETFTMNNNSRVVLVGHSMGNMYTLYFLNHQPQQWKDKYIRSFVSLAGPWGGAAKTLRLMSSGDSLGFYSIILNPLEIRPQQRSMPSTAWLLPTDSVWSPDDVLVSRPGYNYTLKDYKKFFQDLNFMDGWYMRQDTEGLTRKLSPPGVEVHCVHGLGVKTPAAFSFTEKQWPDSQPTVTYSNGDGTVNSRSLEGCLLWQERQPQSVYHYVIPNAEHMQLLYNADAIKIIKKVAGSDTP